MKDIEFILENTPGQLAYIGKLLGNNGISLEGGGLFTLGNQAIAHFLVTEAIRAKEILLKHNIEQVKINEVIIQKLNQDIPGQLGTFCNLLAEANINILVQYSDHYNQLIIVPDQIEKAQYISAKWMDEYTANK
ncbi:amino acid-binding ACT domain-containing protein [Myroides marinus]|uniref:amino acid-binding ACT domain-containing protein n=1 Tax=Myroides TaxID=76831 RepID=UPI0025772BF3|nr:amino acid-binding ACT domain-containing protein [Myroides marinus]MDM1347968.1 amino acid-binding ACT domain-containing protein [Myroides marinus]MDM1351540.1 amino acid-binding ACT domain-containing protein [Myroides marinus]MDM1354901.1 amino acid-binding ACT domain-containing protein [Myroides marinus]MDM1358721.1 amino acid-binding ACT domain-containing protein [Myroides marinus]MDM1364554.1 amino acid-binding ACT domain-containing protein [Myroides marinus]